MIRLIPYESIQDEQDGLVALRMQMIASFPRNSTIWYWVTPASKKIQSGCIQRLKIMAITSILQTILHSGKKKST